VLSRPGQLRRLTTDSRTIAHESRTHDPVSGPQLGVASGGQPAPNSERPERRSERCFGARTSRSG